MFSSIRRRLSSAHVIALLALFLALGGTSFAEPVRHAAAKLITGKQVKNGSLTGADVKDRSLTAKDFKGSVTGPQGPKGDKGDAGARGPSGATEVFRASATRDDQLSGLNDDPTPISMSSAGWSQGTDDVDMLTGWVTVTMPPTCDGFPVGRVSVNVDGETVGAAAFTWRPGAPNLEVSAPMFDTGGRMLPPIGGAKQHAVSVEATDECNDAEWFTVKKVELRAYRFR